MEVKVDVRLNGLEEALQQLGPKLARRALRKAAKQVGEMWKTEIAARAPDDTGNLRDSIDYVVKTKAGKGGAPSTVRVSVGPAWDKDSKGKGDDSQQAAVYALMTEFGSKHQVAKPFMRPAFDSTADKAVDIFINTLRADLDDVVKGS